MSTKQDFMVVVTARRYDELEMLISCGNLENHCTSVGVSIAKMVLDGKGQALIPARRLLFTFETDDAVNLMHHHFNFTVKNTQRPLLHELLRFL